MDILTLDLWGYLSEFIQTNQDKCWLMMTCKEISKCQFYFNESIHHKKIIGLLWYNKYF